MTTDLQRLAATCLFASFDGPEAPDWIRRLLDGGLGGVLLFSNNVLDGSRLVALTAGLRDGRDDLLIALDEEGGDVTRLEWAHGSSTPGNAALGAVDDVELTRQVARAVAGTLSAAGINLDLAPVADANVNPANPVIGTRAFGAEPELVARHVGAFVRGLQEAGVGACAKHFPGHGSTEQDSHVELATVNGEVEAGLAPFRAAIEADVLSIMTAHVRVPAFGEPPATLNPRLVQGLLRGELGYDGVVIADALEMKAVADSVGIEEGAVLALLAGVDAVLIGRFIDEETVTGVHCALLDAVATGRLPEERLREAAARVQRAGAWASARAAPQAAEPGIGAEAARRALQSDGATRLSRPALVVELRPEANNAAGEALHSLGAIIAGRVPGTALARLDERSDVGAIADRADGRPLVVVLRDAHRHEWMRTALASLASRADHTIAVEIGLPVWRPPGTAAYIATFGGGRVNLEAAADVLVSTVPDGAAAR
jgi:beta-N-acetylhexosaminidase